MLGADKFDEIDAVIGLENLQEKFGGAKPNLQPGQFYPPRFD